MKMIKLDVELAQIQMTVVTFEAELKSAVLAYAANDFDIYNSRCDLIMRGAKIELWQLVEALSVAREALPDFTPEVKPAAPKIAPFSERMANAAAATKWERKFNRRIELAEVHAAGC